MRFELWHGFAWLASCPPHESTSPCHLCRRAHRYANCSILQPDATGNLAATNIVGVGSPLAMGCPAGQCHNAQYVYVGADVEPFSTTAAVAEQVVAVYTQSGVPKVQSDAYTIAWKLPNLSLKAKFFGYLTIETQYRSETKEVLQRLLQIMYDGGVTTREEVEGFFVFSGCYTGFTRNEELKHKLLDPPVQLGSRRISSAGGASSDRTIAIVAVVVACVAVLGNIVAWRVVRGVLRHGPGLPSAGVVEVHPSNSKSLVLSDATVAASI